MSGQVNTKYIATALDYLCIITIFALLSHAMITVQIY